MSTENIVYVCQKELNRKDPEEFYKIVGDKAGKKTSMFWCGDRLNLGNMGATRVFFTNGEGYYGETYELDKSWFEQKRHAAKTVVKYLSGWSDYVFGLIAEYGDDLLRDDIELNVVEYGYAMDVRKAMAESDFMDALFDFGIGADVDNLGLLYHFCLFILNYDNMSSDDYKDSLVAYVFVG